MNKQLTLIFASLLAINAVTVNAENNALSDTNERDKIVQLNSWFQALNSKSNLLKDHEMQPFKQMGEGIGKLGANWNNTWQANAINAYNNTYNPAAQNLLNSVNNSISSLREKFTTPRRSVRFRAINELLDELEQIITNLFEKVDGQVRKESPKTLQGAAQIGKVGNMFNIFIEDIQSIKKKTDAYLALKGD